MRQFKTSQSSYPSRLITMGWIFIASFSIIACGDQAANSIVSGATVVTETQDGNAQVRLDLMLNTRNIRLPAFSLPILDPNQISGAALGTVSLRPSFSGGGGMLSVSVNLTRALNERPFNDRLPNGNPLPISVNGAEILGFDIKDSPSKVYVALAPGVAMLGVAITLKELDSLGRSVGGANLFPSFQSGEIRGVAGIYTSSFSNQSGIGIFTDFGKLLEKENQSGVLLAKVSHLSAVDLATTQLAQAASKPSVIRFSRRSLARSSERKMTRWLYQMDRKHERSGRERLTLAENPRRLRKPLKNWYDPWKKYF